MDDKIKGLEFKGVPFSFGRMMEPPMYMPYPPLVPTPLPIRPNVRAALDYLDGFLAKGGQDAMELWDVLTALRGPDEVPDLYRADSATSPKRTTTIPIRRAALPRTAAATWRVYPVDPGVHQRASFGAMGAEYPFLGRKHDPYSNNHFANHGARAAQALGLI